jgi:peptidoglycan/xylan/chitin deacetylase (PgdA/CDA1 family)
MINPVVIHFQPWRRTFKAMGRLLRAIFAVLCIAIVASAPARAELKAYDELDYIGAFGTGPWLHVDTSNVRIIMHGPRDSMKVALGFDDGPFLCTNSILDTLAAHGVKATFFLVGIQVEKYPDIAARIVNEGHEVGNHSYSHKLLTQVDETAQHYQIDRASNVIYDAVEILPAIFRPPYRGYNDEILDYVNGAGMTMVLWDVDPKDWGTHSASLIKQRILSHVRPGSILTLHDLSAGTRDALDSIIESLQDMGYEIVTAGELIEDLAIEKAANESSIEGG